MSDGKNNISSLILGVALGAALTYLFTTQKGQRIKEKLLAEGQNLLEDIGEKIANLEEEIMEGKAPSEHRSQSEREELEEKLEDSVKEIATKGEPRTYDEREEKIEETTDEVPQHIEQIQKKGRRFFFRRHGASQES